MRPIKPGPFSSLKSAKWERKPLGAVADLCLGKMLDQKKNRGEPFPYLANVNVRWGEFALDNLRMMRFEPHEMDRYGLKYGDIVMCEGGEPGRCAIWKNQIPGMMIQKAIHRIRPKDFLDNRYLFYSLLNIGQSNKFDQYFTGATIKHLPGEKLAKVEVDIPPLPIQRRIASILSAYDDLIENNTRRIAILEEMARRIYEEWFVSFRFPGHEQVRMVESELGLIPEGWGKVDFSSLCKSVEDGDWIETKDQGGEDYRLLQISNVGVNRFVETGNFRFISAETFQRLRCREVKSGHILIARMPKPIGRAWLVTDQQWRMVTAVDAAIVEPDIAKTSPEFLLHFLNAEGTLAAFAAQASGTTRLRITRRQIEAMPLIAPPVELAKRFSDVVEPTNRSIATHERRNINLRTTRDLLLPKLISGELDVSDLSEPEAMAA